MRPWAVDSSEVNCQLLLSVGKRQTRYPASASARNWLQTAPSRPASRRDASQIPLCNIATTAGL